MGCGGSGAKDCDGSACKPRWWMCGDRFFFFFFWCLCGGYFLWIWLSVVVFRGLNFVLFPLWWLFLVVVVVVGGGFGDPSYGFSCGCGLLGLI